jgi:hypothetical protein
MRPVRLAVVNARHTASSAVKDFVSFLGMVQNSRELD